ncbi:MAG TPA: sodium:solute symporter, partial [Tepidisphaeraceae bacterium]
MNALDWAVLLGTLLGIAGYGIWRTRGRRDLSTYLRGKGDTRWFVVGLSVMATQASAITFLSTPGQGYESGLGFVQNYFGAPLALIVICAVFLPIYRKLNVYTAYEFLGQRFDTKTRLLGASLFLLQRGLGAGITIYAPAIVLSAVMGWRLDLTIMLSGLLVIIYTVAGGSDAVTHTQKYQLAVIFAGMFAAFAVLLHKLPAGLRFSDAMVVAGGFHKLQAVDFSFDPNRRYTFWTGVLGGMFLALSYFGTDQSQVQRYISGASLRESRMGLMFNAVCKIPMQFFILLLGAMLFVFYQFERPPIIFRTIDPSHVATALDERFSAVHADKEKQINEWLAARHAGDAEAEAQARARAFSANSELDRIRGEAKAQLSATDAKVNDADYVFIRFILSYLPHGLIGLLVTAFFAAALSAKAAELNGLASTSVIDVYRHMIKRDADDHHYLVASKCLVIVWGLVAIGFALFAHLVENLIQAGNIIASVFYPIILGVFLIGFFLRDIRGTAVFWGAIAAQVLVLVLYFSLPISYLWYNVIGCAACICFSMLLQLLLGKPPQARGFDVIT